MKAFASLLPLAVAFFATSAHVASQDIVIDRMWSTTWDYSKVQELSNPAIKFTPGTALTQSVNVTEAQGKANPKLHDQVGVTIHENQIHQIVDSFGGGIADSVAISLQDFKKKHPQDYDDLLHLLFSTEPEWFRKGGVGMNSVRVPLGACDFGVSPYTYDDTEDGSEDPNLELFTIKKAPKLWATLKDIVAINPNLKIFTAAWSAPGWMKENTNADQPLFGGDLKPGMEQTYANYLIKAVTDIKKEEGLDIFALSPGNEPQIPELKYPTMKISADQSIQLGKLLRDGLDKAGFKNTLLLVWDFNWDNTDYPLQVLNADPAPWNGIAWHGYSGKPSAQKVITDAFPSIETYFTEKTQITQYFSEPYKNMKNSARDLLIGSIRYASKSVVMWNLVLRKDEDGFTTPHLPNVCQNCNAAVLLLPESTDAVAGGDANHTMTLAEAASGAKKDATAPATAPAATTDDKKNTPATAPVVPAVDANKAAPATAPVVPATADKRSAPAVAPAAATTDDKKNTPAVAPAAGAAVAPAVLSKRRLDDKNEDIRKRHRSVTDWLAGFVSDKDVHHSNSAFLRRRADTETVTLKPSTTDPTFGTGIVAPRSGDGGGSEAVLASKIVDAKKTGNPNVYDSDLFKRTSDFSVLSHLSTAVRPDGSSRSFSKRIGVDSTDELQGELDGRLLAQAFRQDGVKPGVTRFSIIMLNQNDHYETGVWEEITTVIAFRGMTANVTTVPGLYTLSWEAPTVAPQTDLTQAGAGATAATDTKKDDAATQDASQ